MALVKYIFYRLTQLGLKVTVVLASELAESISESLKISSPPYKYVTVAAHNADHDNLCQHNSEDEISRSSIVVACLSNAFQNNKICMDELRYARKCKPPKLIIPVFVDSNYEDWCAMDLSYLCQIQAEDVIKFDFSKYNSPSPAPPLIGVVLNIKSDEKNHNDDVEIKEINLNNGNNNNSNSNNNNNNTNDEVAIEVKSKETHPMEDVSPHIKANGERNRDMVISSFDDEYLAFKAAQDDVDLLYKQIQIVLPEQLLTANRDAIKKAFEPKSTRLPSPR
jgi:hypothetical protein